MSGSKCLSSLWLGRPPESSGRGSEHFTIGIPDRPGEIDNDVSKIRRSAETISKSAAAAAGRPEAAAIAPGTRIDPVGWRRLWFEVRDFAGAGGGATYLWTRWLVLRAVGLVYLFIFAGAIDESPAIIGPAGVAPLAGYFAQVRPVLAGFIDKVLHAPTVFWFGQSAGFIGVMGWMGLIAAGALVFNLWPRLALFVCWLLHLSFTATWGEFTPTQIDNMMMEVALLAIPFAPPGLRPGLAAGAPPWPITVFMMRWLLFRGMFESGLAKLVSDSPVWRNFTAMDFMYETSPTSTVLGYWAHQLPHGYHVFEILFTFAAELVAPVLAVFGGRRGRWWALLLWTLLQAGIQLTGNFGWINVGAAGLGLMLLDDQMIAAAAHRLRRTALANWLAQQVAGQTSPAIPPWRRQGLRALLGLHFAVTLYYFAKVCRLPVESAPAIIAAPISWVADFRSANRYYLFEHLASTHLQVDFEGSNDSGRTWRTFELRDLPQREDRMAGFIAPRFPRFENTIFFESSRPGETSVITVVATELLRHNPEIMARFKRDPFPDRPPTIIRMRRYRLVLLDREAHRQTGQYWRKEFAGDYVPPFHRNEIGAVAPFDLGAPDAAAKAGDFAKALSGYEEQFAQGNLEAGFRLAEMYVRGQTGAVALEKAFALFSDLASRGEIKARHSAGLCYEHGVGVALDLEKAVANYQQAADKGFVLSMFSLGSIGVRQAVRSLNDVEALGWLLTAAERTKGEDQTYQRIRDALPGLTQQLMARMSAAQISAGRQFAAQRR